MAGAGVSGGSSDDSDDAVVLSVVVSVELVEVESVEAPDRPEALEPLDAESVERLEPDARAVGEPLELDQEARLVAVLGHGLAQHHQPAVVVGEGLSLLLAQRSGLLRLLELRAGAASTSCFRLAACSRLGLSATSQKAAISPTTTSAMTMVSSLRLMAPSPSRG